MRDCNFYFPTNNKAAVTITSALYDRRALDCTAPLALVNSLSHLHYLINTSTRIRELVSKDGGFERLMRILRNTSVKSQRVMNVWKWSLTFNCLVAAGIRGTYEIRMGLVNVNFICVLLDIMEAYLAILKLHSINNVGVDSGSYPALAGLSNNSYHRLNNNTTPNTGQRLGQPTDRNLPQDTTPQQYRNTLVNAQAAAVLQGPAVSNPANANNSDEDSGPDEADLNDIARYRNLPVHNTTRSENPILHQFPQAAGSVTTATAAASISQSGAPVSPTLPSRELSLDNNRPSTSRNSHAVSESRSENASATTQDNTGSRLTNPSSVTRPIPTRPSVSNTKTTSISGQPESNEDRVNRPARSVLTPPPPDVEDELTSEVTMLPVSNTNLYHHIVPQNVMFRMEDVLHSLQLLGYLSKYPEIRGKMHQNYKCNVFEIVEQFTYRGHHPDLRRWAVVVMRNACNKDESRKGLRQCANFRCLRWESYPREFAKCRRCRKAKYCSRECQSASWESGHRYWCTPVQPKEATEIDQQEARNRAENASITTATPASAVTEAGNTASMASLSGHRGSVGMSTNRRLSNQSGASSSIQNSRDFITTNMQQPPGMSVRGVTAAISGTTPTHVTLENQRPSSSTHPITSTSAIDVSHTLHQGQPPDNQP
ncbi:hypothetical protein IWQ61_008038 [Dispira simplex]|nr:hypothetical protein IWQ61_008038 [Dispira simplex]